MRREVLKATNRGVGATVLLGVLILIGSRNLAHFDAALVAYTAAVLFATFGLIYRYVMWIQRPPTAVYWKRGWQTFFMGDHRSRNQGAWVNHIFNDFLINRFILARNRARGITHSLITWGCMLYLSIITLIFYRFTFLELTTTTLNGNYAISKRLYSFLLGGRHLVDSLAFYFGRLASSLQAASPDL